MTIARGIWHGLVSAWETVKDEPLIVAAVVAAVILLGLIA